MQSLDIFLEVKKSQQNNNRAPQQTPLKQLFHLYLLQKMEHTYARPVIIQLGVGSETPLGLLCCQWVTVKSLN